MAVPAKLLLRTVIAILVGFVVGFIVVAVLSLGIDAMARAFAPTRDDLISNDRNALLQRAHAIWTGSVLGLAFACAVGAVVGSWVAARIAPASHAALHAVIGALLLLGATQAMLIVGQPLWVFGTALALFPLCAYVARRLAALGRDAA